MRLAFVNRKKVMKVINYYLFTAIIIGFNLLVAEWFTTVGGYYILYIPILIISLILMERAAWFTYRRINRRNK